MKCKKRIIFVNFEDELAERNNFVKISKCSENQQYG